MRDNKTVTLSFLVLGLAVGTASAQVQQDVPESNLISKSVKAVGYRVGGGSTKVDLKGTELMSLASGEAAFVHTGKLIRFDSCTAVGFNVACPQATSSGNFA